MITIAAIIPPLGGGYKKKKQNFYAKLQFTACTLDLLQEKINWGFYEYKTFGPFLSLAFCYYSETGIKETPSGPSLVSTEYRLILQ